MTTRSEAPTYFDLAARLHEVAVLGSVGHLLGWDEQVMMPTAGVAWRSEQAATIAQLAHDKFTEPRTGALIAAAEAIALDDDQKVVVRECRRDYGRAAKIPTSLVTALSRATVLSQAAWVEARSSHDFSKFAPWLQKVLDLKRQEAACLAGEFADPYDALLDAYEPGETAAALRPVFAALRPRLVELLNRVRGSTVTLRTDMLERAFPTDAQERLMRRLIGELGFDTAAGRIDTSVHPFCSGIAAGDTRITTRYSTTDFAGALLGTLHETGHALYEQGLPKAKFPGTALAEATSLGIHESQSRLWENQVGRGRAFATFLWPKFQETFGNAIGNVTETDWLVAINRITPSFIRTESDELTYNLHILLRFELEHALVNGTLAVADLPAAWNKSFKDLLGLDVPDDAMGCLQDVHWSGGMFGYFPTYMLGNLYAAQFYEAAETALPDLQSEIATGQFGGLRHWLRENVHQHGRRYSARELCRRITGRELSPDALLRRLEKKVSDFYGV